MRKAGILMPITSLPSPYGIGTMGEAAREFVRFLHKAGNHTGRYYQYVRQVMEIRRISHFHHMQEIRI